MTVKNRTFMAPMSLGYESEDGTINERMQAYWLERAKGGIGCIIVDALSVDPRVPYLGNTLSFRGEESIQSYKNFTDAVHKYGTKIIPQITHPGPESVSAFYGVPPVASSVYINSMGQKTRELALEEIPQIIEQYASASYAAKLAGFDGIELHCAHAYMLLGSFLSPLRNKRTDQYGGSLDNRARLLLEVIDAIKEKCGADFPIVLRISGSERNDQGNDLSDILRLVPTLIAHGIDAFEVSGGTQYENCNKIIPCHGEKSGVNVEEAKAIKSISSVPVIVVGKINEASHARYLVDSGDVDGVVLGRALLADADFVIKAEENRDNEIAPCAACGIGCIGEQMKRKPASCIINPALGREQELTISLSQSPEKIVIIGGGIGGMTAARSLALGGHAVTLIEKSDKLGGQLNVACMPPHKQEISKWIVFLNNELKRLGVEVVYSTTAIKEIIDAYAPDRVIVATGAKEIIPPVPGVDIENAIVAQKVLKNETVILGGNILVVGGGMVGCEVAEHLMHQMRGPMTVTLIEMGDTIGGGMIPNNLIKMMQRLNANGIKMMTKTKLLSVNSNAVTVEFGGESITLNDFTHIIYACGSRAENELFESIKNDYESISCIGDANSPRQALEAAREGWLIA